MALPFSYLPHEIVVSGPNITLAILGLTFLTGVKYGVLHRKDGAIDTIAIILAIYVIFRLLVLSPVQGVSEGVPWDEAAKAGGTLAAGVVLLRLGQREDLRPAIIRALRLMVIMLLGFEAYQMAAGLPRLKAIGYSTGFYYFTEAGAYRPFGTFLSPTVFGGYLAIVGAIVAATSRGKWAFFWLVAITAGLVLTETRAAWIAFAVAMLTLLFMQSKERRSRTLPVVIAAAWIGMIVVLINPDLLATQWDRLQSISDAGFTSNSSRLDLWSGAVSAFWESPLIGYAPAGFTDVAYKFIGLTATLGHAHNNYLQILFMYGAVGLFLVLLIILRSMGSMLRRIRAGVPGYALGSFAALAAFMTDSFFETTWTSLSVVSTLFLIIGIGLPATLNQTAVPAASRQTVPSE